MMTKEGLAQAIISGTGGLDKPSSALDAFWKSICDYVENNAEVEYGWIATNSTGTPDPMVKFTATITTSGKLSLSGLSDPGAALASLSGEMNSNASIWTVNPPEGFSLSPLFVIPTITLTLSGATERQSAIEHLAQNILDGLKTATPSGSGVHAAYTGSSSFVTIK